MPPSGALPGLPGSTADAGAGPAEAAVLDGLLDDGLLNDGLLNGGDDVPAALARHRDLTEGARRDLVATLVVPAALAPRLPEHLDAVGLGTRVLLVTGGPDPLAALHDLDAAGALLRDADRLEIVGRRLPLPPGADVLALLDALASTVPTWLAPAPGTPAAVLDELARDGAEGVTLDLAAGDPADLARLLRDLVDRELAFRVAGAPGALAAAGVPGALNALCAVRAALNGAEPADLALVLAADDAGGLVSAVRRMSAADAAVTRSFLVAVEVADATATAAELELLGLVGNR